MSRYDNIEKLEINFMKINNHDPMTSDSKLWLYDLLGFLYGNMTDEQIENLVERSEKRVWEYEQYMNEKHELLYETEAGK